MDRCESIGFVRQTIPKVNDKENIALKVNHGLSYGKKLYKPQSKRDQMLLELVVPRNPGNDRKK